jgi:predicted RND superfamily exporter protein
MRGGRAAEAWVRFSERRSGLLLALGALVAVLGAAGSVQLFSDLRADMTELLPREARSARDVERVTARVGGWAEESIALHGPDPAALRRFADALAPRLEALPALVQSVEYRIDDVRRFYDARRWLFPTQGDLEALRDRLTARLRWEKQRANPLFVSLDDDPAPSVDEIVDRIRAKNPGAGLLDRFPDGYFLREVADPTGAKTNALVIRVRMAGNPNDFAQVDAVDREVHRVVQGLAAERALEPVAVSYGGYVASTVFEHRGLAEDLVVATLLVILAVAGAIALYYRTPKAIVAIGLPLAVGTLATFGLADLMVGHLNSNTAFLGSIVIGNGINVGLILFARYAEERRSGAIPGAAMAVAVRETWLATLTAALAAGISYGSLVVTDFRGFTQFGLIGGVGMAACWLATYALTPAWVLAWERRGTLIAPTATPPAPFLMGRIAALVERAPRALLLASLALSAVAVIGVVRFARDPMEYDFGKLRDSRALDNGGPAFWEDAIFGGHLDPCIVLARDEAEARVVAAAFEAKGKGAEGTIGAVTSIASFVPEGQAAKLPAIAAIGALATPGAMKLAPPALRARIEESRPPPGLAPFAATDLPPVLQRRLVEKDGTLGTPVLVYPAAGIDVWNGRDALRVERDLKSATLPRADIPMASSLLVFADVLHALTRDGPRATLLSFLGVALLVVLLFGAGTGRAGGPADAGLVLGALLAGTLLFGGLAGALGLKLNMLSFIALPITFGIGVDYAANVVQRRRVSGASFGTCLRTTGGAVALCSLTTIIGYSSLLVAHNRALRSFGVLADLGELACLATALLVLPAFGRMREAR